LCELFREIFSKPAKGDSRPFKRTSPAGRPYSSVLHFNDAKGESIISPNFIAAGQYE